MKKANNRNRSKIPCTPIEQLKAILKAYHDRIRSLEDKKYDVEYIVKRKDVEVQSLNSHKQIQNITLN